MNILGIDTSTKTMSIGLLQDEKILAELNFYSNMDHSESLIKNIGFILGANNLTMTDIDLVGVAIGPGSFTGIRIGIATVKGLLEFFEKPVAPVSSLEALSRNFSSEKYVAVAVDAKRDRVYGGLFSYSGGESKVIIREGLYNISEFKESLKEYGALVLVGDLLDQFEDLDKVRFAREGNLLNRASNICFIAKNLYEKDLTKSHLDLEANYMTKSQAQIDYEKRQK